MALRDRAHNRTDGKSASHIYPLGTGLRLDKVVIGDRKTKIHCSVLIDEFDVTRSELEV